MKTAAITLLGALAAMAAAQGDSVPKCGEFCVNDMRNGQAASLGCDADDIACLCANKDFAYGLRDCSAATCPDQDARKIIEYGVSICKQAGVDVTDAPTDGSPSPTGGNGGDGNGKGDGDDNGDGGSGSVSTIFSTKTSDGSVLTTAISTTTLTGGKGGDDGDNSGSASKTTGGAGGHDGAVVTTITSDGSTITSTLSGTKTSGSDDKTTMATATSSGAETSSTGGSDDNSEGGGAGNTEGGNSDETGGSGGSETTTGSDDAAPQATAAPVGILAAAGIAALML